MSYMASCRALSLVCTDSQEGQEEEERGRRPRPGALTGEQAPIFIHSWDRVPSVSLQTPALHRDLTTQSQDRLTTLSPSTLHFEGFPASFPGSESLAPGGCLTVTCLINAVMDQSSVALFPFSLIL